MEDVEMDYDNVYLNKHIEALKPETFKIYLDILLNFIKSDNIKICFPDMTGPLKVIFVEIVEDIRTLTSRCIDESCKPLCNEIINLLEANRTVFKLLCTGDSSSISGLVLKKKIFFGNTSDQKKTELKPGGLTMEALNKKLDRLNNQSSITTGFKLQCLNTALKFIKDDSQLFKEYSDLTAPQAELITTLICNPNVNSDIGFGFKSFYAPLWEAMKIFGLKYEFKIRETDSGGGKKNLILQKIAKNYKMEIKNNIKPTPMDTSESDISFQSDTSTSKKKKIRKSDTILRRLPTKFVEKSLIKITEFYNDDAMASVTFNGLTEDEYFFLFNFKNVLSSKRMRSVFEKQVRMIFEKVIELAQSKDNYKLCVKKMKMCDNSNKSITFTKIPVFKNHGSWVDAMDKKENTPFNSSSDRSVSRERGNIKICFNTKKNTIKDDTDSSASGVIKKSVDRCTLNVSKPVPSLFRRSLLLNSVHQNSEALPTKHANSTKTQPNVKGAADSVLETYIVSVDNPKEHKARERNKSVILPLKNNMAVNNFLNKVRDTTSRSDQSTDRSVSKDRRANAICFQPGGVLDPHRSESIDRAQAIDNTIGKEEPNQRERFRRSGVDLNNRKVKLLEAMSVPIKSDKGLRMMRGMGWEGGALGLRGEGITEPLIPALDRVAWAGLGHVAPPKPVKLKPRKPVEFRLALLQGVLKLVSSDLDQKVLTYQPILQKKEKNFLKQIIQCFSARSRMDLVDEEMVLYNSILRLLKANPNLMVRGCVAPCKSQIHLSKVENIHNSIPNLDIHSGDVTILVRIAKIEEKIKRVLKGDLIDMLATLEHDCQSKKSYNLLEFKIDILINILEFFKAKELKMTWCSRENLNRKKINYIDYAMESIDLRARFGSTEPEIALVKEILRLAGDFRLEYTFFNQYKSFTVTKVYKPRNISNAHKNKNVTNNNYDSINNNISTNKANVLKNTDNTAKSDIDNTDSMLLSSEVTEDPVSSSDDVIIVEGRESPIVISDDENYLLGAPMTNWDDDIEDATVYEAENTMVTEKGKTKGCETEKTTDQETQKTTGCKTNTKDFEAEKARVYETRETMDNKTVKTSDCDTKTMHNETEKMVNKTTCYETNTMDCENENTKRYKTEPPIVNETEKTMLNMTGRTMGYQPNNMDYYETENTMIHKTGKTTCCERNTMDYDTEKTEGCANEETTGCETKNMVYVAEETIVNKTGKTLVSETEMKDCENENTTVRDTENATYLLIENTMVYNIDKSTGKEAGDTVPDLVVSKNCDNYDNDLVELEKAIQGADEVGQASSPLSKRSRSESPNSDIKMSKLTKLETKKVYIVHSNYPIDRLSKVNVQNLQEIISCYILKSQYLPLLKCHGVQDGALVYSCHTESSYYWLQNTISDASDVKILETKEVIEDAYKMSLKFNCYFEFDVDYLFDMLELYNKDLSTGKWMVLKHHVFMDHVCFIVKMDITSYYYIRNSGYSLYAGVDEVQFSIIWD